MLKKILNLTLFFLFVFFIEMLSGVIHHVIQTLKEAPIVDSCNNETLESIVECLNQNFTSFYKYNSSKVGKTLTFEEFKNEGGVCLHSSIWYWRQLREYDVAVKPLIIKVEELGPQNTTGYHIFLIAHKKNEYCLIDQNEYKCYMLSN